MDRINLCRGCLMGMAVGDAMGYSVDNKSWEEICESYGPNGLLGYDLQNDYADITSHTQIAAFMANGLLVAATRAKPEMYHKYTALAMKEWAKAQQFRGAGERTHLWVAQIPALRRRMCMDTRMLDALGRDILGTPESPTNNASSPGSIAAAVGVGLFYDSQRMELSQIGALATQAVALTHGDPETFISGAVVAYAVASILQDPEKTLPEHLNRALKAVNQQYYDRYCQAVESITDKLRYAVSLTRDPELTPLAAMTLLGCTTASECLAGAVYACMIHPANFDEAMIVSVNHSGKSSAVGALTGALLGAKLGFDALPDFYLESIEPVEALEELAKDLTIGRQTTRIFDDSWDQKYIQGLPVSN